MDPTAITSARASTSPTRHQQHDRAHVDALLARYRTKLGIPPAYSISVELRCPKQMPDAYGSVSWDYLPSRTYLIRLRCDLSAEEMEWILVHELFELMTADLAQFTETQLQTRPRALRALLDERHREIRDQTIEWLCFLELGRQRPQLLLGER